MWGIALALVLLLADSPLELFRNALDALAHGDYSAAEKGFQQVLRDVPNHPGAMLNLGVVYSRTGRYDEAIAQYRAVLKSNLAEKSALANLAIALVKKQDYADALPVFQKLAALNPTSAALRDPDLLYQFASAYLRRDRTDAARQSVAALLSGAAGDYVSCRLAFDAGHFDEAESACRQSLAEGGTFPGLHTALGKVLVSEHSPDAAKELSLAIAQDPKDPEAQYSMGVALLDDGQPSAAAPYLERAMELDPSFWGTYFYLGRAKLDLGQPADAVPLLRQAAEKNPRAATVFYELGRALISAGKPAEAKQAMQRVRELRAQELETDAQALRKH